MGRWAGCVAVVASWLVVAVPAASAHDQLGRAQPGVETTVKGSGLTRAVTIRVRDVDSGNPIPAATLSASARGEDGTVVPGSVARVGPERFRLALDLPGPGRWRVGVRIGGDAVVPTAYSFDVDAAGRSRVDPPSGRGGAGPVVWISAVAAAAGTAAIACFVVVRRRARR